MKPEVFVKELKRIGYGPYIGVPCSILKELINYLVTSEKDLYYAAANEGEAMGLASGFALSNRIPVVMMQNSGLGNIVNPLTSLSLVFNFRALLLITLRGEKGTNDEPQHSIMGEITESLLKLLKIEYEILDVDNYVLQLEGLYEKMCLLDRPVALLIRSKTFRASNKLEQRTEMQTLQRVDAIKCICNTIRKEDIIISTTGKISRELYFFGRECESNFYVIGAMGCAASIGLAIAIDNPHKRVIVLDGDGSILMKMGTLATIGRYKVNNLLHIVLDNEEYESTGGQPSSSSVARIDLVARGCGYDKTYLVDEIEGLHKCLIQELSSQGTVMIVVKVKGGMQKLGRPEKQPMFYKNRFFDFLNRGM